MTGVAVPKPVRVWLPDYRDWIRALPCLICFGYLLHVGAGLSDPCHVEGRGAGHDDPYNLLPMCRWHHDLQHAQGWGAVFRGYPPGCDAPIRRALYYATCYYLAWLRVAPQGPFAF